MASKNTPSKKTPSKKTPAKKVAAKKAPAKKSAAKKPAKKAAAKTTAAKKSVDKNVVTDTGPRHPLSPAQFESGRVDRPDEEKVDVWVLPRKTPVKRNFGQRIFDRILDLFT